MTAPRDVQRRTVAHVRWADIVDRHFLLLLSAAALLVLVLNWRATGQEGMHPYYMDFRDVIRAGFDPAAATRKGIPTFPMWGYGWLLLLTTQKLPLRLLQIALGVGALWLWSNALEREGLLKGRALTVYRVLAILTTPWFALHSVPWPSSISASLTLAAAALVPHIYRAGQTRWLPILAGGLLLGVAGNFRSDVLLLALALAPVLVISGHLRPSVWLRLGVWLGSAYGLMLPWLIFTWCVTGMPLLTSTNAGLTALTGFGEVRDNRWGITLNDEDPAVAQLIVRRLGHPAPPVSFAADRVLKEEFARLVRADPGEYLRKVRRTLWRHVTGGAAAEFYRWLARDPTVAYDHYAVLRRALPRGDVAALLRDPGATAIMALQGMTALVGVVLIAMSFALLPVTAAAALVRRQPFALVFLVVIAYTALVVAFLANADSRFVGPVFPCHLANLVLGGAVLISGLRRRRSGQSPTADV